jgi:hypothetical protein
MPPDTLRTLSSQEPDKLNSQTQDIGGCRNRMFLCLLCLQQPRGMFHDKTNSRVGIILGDLTGRTEYCVDAGTVNRKGACVRAGRLCFLAIQGYVLNKRTE